MRINHNLAALNAYNALNSTTDGLAKAVERLSTGLRINSASDDAAGLAVSEKMRSQIGGLGMAARNAQDGISMIQTAEGALNEIQSMLQRMRELAVQSANDTLTAQDRSYIQDEVDQLKGAIDRIASTTQFNKKRLLDGSALWSSDKLTTAVITKGDAPAGNYRIEITATPGVGQVQKSNVMAIEYDHVTTPVAPTTPGITPSDTIDISDGTDRSGTGWNFSGGVLSITGDGSYEITGST